MNRKYNCKVSSKNTKRLPNNLQNTTRDYFFAAPCMWACLKFTTGNSSIAGKTGYRTDWIAFEDISTFHLNLLYSWMFSTPLQHQSVVSSSCPHNLGLPRFQRCCPSVWNSLPSGIRACSSSHAFHHLKTHCFNQAFSYP